MTNHQWEKEGQKTGSVPSLIIFIQSLNIHKKDIWQILRLKRPVWADLELDHVGPVINPKDTPAGLTSPSITPSASSPPGPTWWVQGVRSPIGRRLGHPQCVCCRHEPFCIVNVFNQVESLLYFNILWIIIKQWLLVPHKELSGLSDCVLVC